MSELSKAIAFFDKVQSASESERIAVGGDHLDRLVSAARKAIDIEEESSQYKFLAEQKDAVISDLVEALESATEILQEVFDDTSAINACIDTNDLAYFKRVISKAKAKAKEKEN